VSAGDAHVLGVEGEADAATRAEVGEGEVDAGDAEGAGEEDA